MSVASTPPLPFFYASTSFLPHLHFLSSTPPLPSTPTLSLSLYIYIVHAKGSFSLKQRLSPFLQTGLPEFRGRELNPNIFFSNFSGASGISRQNPGISRQKSLIPWVSRDIPNFLAPTPSRGRPPPHQKISRLKSLGLGSFFVPEKLADSHGGFVFFFNLGHALKTYIDSVHTRCIVKTSGFTRGVCKNRGFY